jgi:hypothetical protein
MVDKGMMDKGMMDKGMMDKGMETTALPSHSRVPNSFAQYLKSDHLWWLGRN